MEDTSSMTLKIKRLIASGRVGDALLLFEALAANSIGENIENKIISLRERWALLNKQLITGTVRNDDANVQRSQIVAHLLEITSELDSTKTAKKPIFHFTKLTLQNLRSFEKKQTLSFQNKDGQPARWNIIIGDNGVGKTTVLRALALVLLFYKNSALWKKQVLPEVFLRGKEKHPHIGFGVKKIMEIDESSMDYQFDLEVTDTDFLPGIASDFLTISDWVEGLNVFAYGASRKIGNTQLTSESNSFPAASLFDENALLTNAEEWLVRTEYLALKGGKAKDTLEKITHLLIRLFDEEIQDIEIQTKGDRPVAMFKTDYGWVELHNLSLGYKTLIGWMVDFAKGMFERYPDSKDPLSEPAVLLIDEIDLHLHPKLQQRLMKFLTDSFPKTQFIATAHSPLVVQSAENSNVILLKKSGDHAVVEQNPFEIKNWRIDQLLTSDLYGLSSARAPQTEAKIERRRAILKKDKRSKKEAAELEKLDEELVGLPVSESPEAIRAMEIIQKAAKHYVQTQNVLVEGDAATVAEPAKHYGQDQNDQN
ncbi:MAG: AAA family ATPase [Saprospiraceae bacterium]|nr:AAA family ATPase [Saprospiraceae bacterium]MDZ4705780.1 AAA family ATPase [Saprospiraceae bacterium]